MPDVDTSEPHLQSWLTDRMSRLGYVCEATCFGVAQMAVQAMLLDELDVFFKRLNVIAAIPVDAFSNDDIAGFPPAFVNEVRAFFEGIVLYQQPAKYPQAFENVPATQNAALSALLTTSVKLERQGGLFLAGSFSGIYTPSALTSYFQGLQKLMERHDHRRLQPVAIVILNIDHAIAVGYSPRNRGWYFVNANKLVSEPVPRVWRLSGMTMTAMSSNWVTAIITRFYGMRQHAGFFRYLFEAWRRTPEWQSIHTISAHNLSLVDSFKISWLHIALEGNQFHTARTLLREGAKVRVRDDYSYLLYAVVEWEQGWIIRLLKKYGANSQSVINKPLDQFHKYISLRNEYVRRRASLFIARQTAAGLVTTHIPITSCQLACILGDQYIMRLLAGSEGIHPDLNPTLLKRLHQFIRRVAPGVYRKAGDYRRAAVYQAAHDLLFLYQCFARLEEEDIPLAAKVGELNDIVQAILSENTGKRTVEYVKVC
ncbi:hypothetical protein [Legionella sp. CNM-4043-24]|uniref:hypothetical protein n=1 Tax=Legionella sp. CNM-4043-24 TaxID=3421646 RepID=UPI00403A8FD1